MGITERIIRDAKADGRARTIWDKQCMGLGLQITPKGVKNFVIRYRTTDGRRRQAIIARAGQISLKGARERAGRELAAVRAGEADPLERRREAKEAPTVSDLAERFFREFVPGRIERGRMAERTAKDYGQQCRRYIVPALGKRRVADVTRADIERMLEPLKPVARNRVASLASRLFRLSEDWGMRRQYSNPVRGVERSVEQPRTRVLSPSELSALGGALADLEDSHLMAVSAIRLCALTGWRIGEVLATQWQHVDLESGLVVQPHTKTGAMTRNVGSAAIELLATVPRLNDNPHVFTGAVAGSAIGYKGVRNIFARAVEAAGLADIRLHDLRRTTATNAAMAGATAPILRDLLGHASFAMSNRYIRRTGGALVEAVEQSSASMAAALDGGKGNVVRLRGRAER